jgi:hypothetical protein
MQREIILAKKYCTICLGNQSLSHDESAQKTQLLCDTKSQSHIFGLTIIFPRLVTIQRADFISCRFKAYWSKCLQHSILHVELIKIQRIAQTYCTSQMQNLLHWLHSKLMLLEMLHREECKNT